MNLFKTYSQTFRDWNVLNGRARRLQYLGFNICHWVVMVLFVILDVALLAAIQLPICTLVYVLVSLVPSFTLTIRRLHDAGMSGWFFLLFFIPFVTFIMTLVTLFWPSQEEDNKWGPNPKRRAVAEDELTLETKDAKSS